MPAIYLIRHGQASFGQENYDQLSELGQRQAQHLGSKLNARIPSFDAINLGTMLRHRQTAELCIDAMGQNATQADLQFDTGWNEYDHQNILAQLNPMLATAEGTEKFIREQSNPAKAFESAFNDAVARWMSGDYVEGYTESWNDFRNRVRNALHNAIAQSPDAKHIAVFTSGGPISLLSQALLGVPEQNLMHLNWTLVNCGITKLVNTKTRTFVATLNEHVHFEGQHGSLITYK
jgi:broad specificity phosphatase PhoE